MKEFINGVGLNHTTQLSGGDSLNVMSGITSELDDVALMDELHSQG